MMELTRNIAGNRAQRAVRRPWAALGFCAILSLGILGSVTACSVTSGQETTGQYVDDATVTTKVKSALASDGGVTLANKVGVETGQGVVQLSGFVPSSTDKERAEDIARSVKGVKGVTNDLVVQP
ncbi:MAG TPA: BON domain-containing protein [Terriglobales bacterium]|nr:BON domain-containing protein [Terriglobales bacterium]